jgi:hypothetical protein
MQASAYNLYLSSLEKRGLRKAAPSKKIQLSFLFFSGAERVVSSGQEIQH